MGVPSPAPSHTAAPPCTAGWVQGIEEGPAPGMGGCVRAGCLQFQPVAEAGGAQLGERQLGERKGCDG